MNVVVVVSNVSCTMCYGGITLLRIHNLLVLGAQYQMEPGPNHSTDESHSLPREGRCKG